MSGSGRPGLRAESRTHPALSDGHFLASETCATSLDGGLKCPRARHPPPAAAAFHLFSVCHSPFEPNLSSLLCESWRRYSCCLFYIPPVPLQPREAFPGKKGSGFSCLRYRTICSAMRCCLGCLFIVCTVGKSEEEAFFFFFFGDLHDH